MNNPKEDNIFFKLPEFIINKIYEYDNTEKEKFTKVVEQIENVCIVCKRAFSETKIIIGDDIFNTSIKIIDCQEKFCCECICNLIYTEQIECPICQNDLSDFFGYQNN